MVNLDNIYIQSNYLTISLFHARGNAAKQPNIHLECGGGGNRDRYLGSFVGVLGEIQIHS